MKDWINNYPYSDIHELNLDWLIKKTKDLSTQVDTLNEEFSKIVVLTEDYINNMINTAIETNNQDLYNRMTALKAEITAEYKSYTDAKIRDLTIYVDNQDVYYDNLAKGYSEDAVIISETYTDNQVLTYTKMVNPITGVYEDVRNVVTDIVSYFHTANSLTAGEYDSLQLTALDYDNYEITAYDYDFNGKTILTTP